MPQYVKYPQLLNEIKSVLINNLEISSDERRREDIDIVENKMTLK